MQLSIITINYNNLEGLRRTINSVMTQTWRDFEWIIVDGGSTDGSKELIEQTAANPNSNISWWCCEPDKGVYNAMNKGIAHAQGEYLNFMNSGDYFYSSTTLNEIFLLVQKHEVADIYYGDHIRYDGKQEKLYKSPSPFPLSILLKYGINHQSTFIKRELFKEELYDESLKIVADWKLFVKWMLSGRRFQYVSIPICFFENGGLCTTQEGIIAQEKDAVKNSLLSANIMADITELESYRSFAEIKEVKEYISERRLHRQFLGSFLRLALLFKNIGL